MGMTRIHILGPHPAAFAAALCEHLPEVEFTTSSSRDHVGDGFQECDVLFTFSDFLKPDSFKNMPNLRWVQSLGTGMDGIIDSLDLADGVALSSMRGIHGPQVSELVFMFMLSLSRDYPQFVKNQSDHVWQRRPGIILQNKTIGLLGVGVISEALAKRCKAFEMEVVGISSTLRDLENFDRMVMRTNLLEVVAEFDFLVVLVPLNDDTRGLVDETIFAAMKNSAYFINVARGGVVDEDALLAALDNGEIAGVGLDVFEQEPLPIDSPLWDHPNLLLTPHIGGMVDVYVEQTTPILRHNIRAFLDGQENTMMNLVKR